MSKTDASQVTHRVIQSVGLSRVQTLMFNELAVSPYRLAQPGHVTRWDRCVAMFYSSFDQLTSAQRTSLPPRPRFFAAGRDACTAGIKQGIVPHSGAPTQSDTAALLTAALAHTSR